MSDPKDSLAVAVLRQLDITIFRRIGSWKYELFGEPSDTYERFIGSADVEAFWMQSEMLDFFLYDVEDYFESGRTGGISSGTWIETRLDAEEASFAANTLEIAGEQLVVVRALGEEYQEKMRILQRARVNLLERRRLSADFSNYKQKSQHDSLTGLFNRATFDELLQEDMAISKSTGANFSLILIDIDDFKKVNDTYGHLAGDEVLSDIGRLLQSILRREDATCRYGGEEFAVLVHHATASQVAYTAEKIRSRLQDYQFNKSPSISVSIGCGAYQPDEDADSFINRVDLALYEAKRTGKNKVVSI
jgi:diguanylate cyclase (GGDEF)-like protein